MSRKIQVFLILIACGTGFYFWWFSDAKVITRSTEKLVECFELESGNGRLGGAISTSTFRDLLDEKISFMIQRDDIPYASEFGTSATKADLVQMMSYITQSAAVIVITDKNITLTEINDDTATVNFTCHIKTEKLPKNIDLALNTMINFAKIEGKWLVSKVLVK